MLLRGIVCISAAGSAGIASAWLPSDPSRVRRNFPPARQSAGRLGATIAPPPPEGAVLAPNGGGDSAQETTWECDEDANCVAVPACDDTECRTSLDVRIHGTWHDLSGWRKAHPAGAHWIDWSDGRDATEVMDGFHSAKGRSMYERLPKSKDKTVQQLEATVEPDTPTQLAFRKLREDLENEGFWERNMVHEYTQLGLWAACVLGAIATAHTVPFVSTCFLSIAMTAAGWLGHDYIHGVDAFADRLRNFAALAAGLSPTWWSDKVCLISACMHFLNVEASAGLVT
jgi:hypothetical protein